MPKKEITIKDFSPHLFWDTKVNSINLIRDKGFIIKRVLEYGFWRDWLLLKDYYGKREIGQTAKDFRELDPKSLTFISVKSQIPLEEFKCYTTKQLQPKHWNF